MIQVSSARKSLLSAREAVFETLSAAPCLGMGRVSPVAVPASQADGGDDVWRRQDAIDEYDQVKASASFVEGACKSAAADVKP